MEIVGSNPIGVAISITKAAGGCPPFCYHRVRRTKCFSESIVIRASPEAVFAYLGDPPPPETTETRTYCIAYVTVTLAYTCTSRAWPSAYVTPPIGYGPTYPAVHAVPPNGEYA